MQQLLLLVQVCRESMPAARSFSSPSPGRPLSFLCDSQGWMHACRSLSSSTCAISPLDIQYQLEYSMCFESPEFWYARSCTEHLDSVSTICQMAGLQRASKGLHTDGTLLLRAKAALSITLLLCAKAALSLTQRHSKSAVCLATAASHLCEKVSKPQKAPGLKGLKTVIFCTKPGALERFDGNRMMRTRTRMWA